MVLVLIILSGMVIISGAMTYRTQLDMKMAQSYAQRTKAYYLALGGIERVRAHLTQKEITPANMTYICSLNTTAQAEKLFEFQGEPDGPDSSLWYCLRDELGYFNLNNSNPTCWEQFEGLEKSHCAAILDWQDDDDDISSEGVESDYYQQLEPPYIAKNSDISFLKELLFIKDIDMKLYVGNDDNPLDLGLVDIFTVHGNGKININTASGTILAALPGLDEDVAQTVISYRSGPDGQEGTQDDIGFESANDLTKLEELTELQRELLGQYSCFDSRFFRIFSRSSLSGHIECSLMATVRYSDNDIELITLERLPK